MTDTTGKENNTVDTSGKIFNFPKFDNFGGNSSKNMNNETNNISIESYIALKEDIKEIKTNLSWMKWLIPILITVGIFVTNHNGDSIKDNMNTQIKMLENKIDSIQSINSMQIQRDVAKEFLNHKR